MAARLRKGDEVIVISGKFKGKTGKVAAVLAEADKVVVEGINVVKRHMKPSPKNQQGGIFEKALPIHACKVMPVDPKTGKGTRVSFKTDDKGNKIRVAKSGETIPNAAREEAVAAQAEG
ncbi:MAG: 50S ribosomal protein L24 [Polyangiaceae bacterium]|jgi:large subunit ribosomal protein L24|nr:50S ribosomal protein L24 [Polyangiaceae bacterium]